MVNLKTQIILRSNFESQHQKIKSRAKRQLATESKRERSEALLKNARTLIFFLILLRLKSWFLKKMENESMVMKDRGIPLYGGKYVQYNILGNLFQVSSKYVPPLQPIGRGAYGIVWYNFFSIFLFSFFSFWK